MVNVAGSIFLYAHMYLIIGVRVAFLWIRGLVSIAGVTERTAFFVCMISAIEFKFVVCDVGCQ